MEETPDDLRYDFRSATDSLSSLGDEEESWDVTLMDMVTVG